MIDGVILCYFYGRVVIVKMAENYYCAKGSDGETSLIVLKRTPCRILLIRLKLVFFCNCHCLINYMCQHKLKESNVIKPHSDLCDPDI